MADKMKILFVQLGTLGDMILATSAFSLIKKTFPNSELHVLSGRRGADVLKFNPHIDKVIINDKSPVQLLKNLYHFASSKYDLYIDPKDHFSREGRMFAKMTRATKKIGFNRDGDTVFDLAARDKEENNRIHYTDRILHALDLAGIEIPESTPRPELFTDPSISIGMQDHIVLNVSAGKESRIWSKENWVSFLNGIDTKGLNFTLINMPSEEEIAAYIISNCPFISRSKTQSIHDVISLVENCKGVITPDTALIHIASAFNKPLLAMLGGDENNNKKFASLSDKRVIIKTETTENDIRNIIPERMIEAWGRFRDML